MVKEVKGQYNQKELEHRIREYWESHKVVQALTKFDPTKKKFYLLDGPPYVNNVAHVGHIKTTTIKDIWSKFKLMQGYSSWFQPGFDTHGLPIENIVEKSLGIKSKKDIEKIGAEKFIQACKEHASGNEKVWLELYKKLGAWRGYVPPYITFENYYIESGWWTVKQLAEKGMLVEGEKSTFWCSHCGTALAGYEVSDSYADVKDPYIYVKFPVKGRDKEFLLAFTTTPWTLVDNVALAVHPQEYYVRVKVGSEIYILAEKRVEAILKDLLKKEKYEVLEKFFGKELDGIKYLPVLSVPAQEKLDKDSHAQHVVMSIPVLKSKSYKHGVIERADEMKESFFDFVNAEEGTGIVHVAPGHGPEDHYMGEHYRLPTPSFVDDEGKFTSEAGEFNGLFVKQADKAIVERLEKRSFLLHFGWITHSYPLCWRCKTPLIYRLTKQWFFTVDLIKELMVKENKKVNWLPKFGKERFHNWLDDAVDWCVSRQRYWGIPLPIWICESCDRKEIIGGLGELKERAANELPHNIDLHKHVVDKIELTCICGSRMKRVPDVLDVWFDSGIAPWASLGYPYKNKELFESLWPADMICESQDQIRGWFYSLMFSGVATFDMAPYKSVSLMGWVLDEKGEKMSKSLGNVIWAEEALAQLGSDITRLYFCWEVAPWEVQNFSYKTADEIRKALNILWNSYTFFTTYSTENLKPTFRNLKIEDKWILSKLNSLIKEVTENYENFEFHLAGRSIVNFVVNDLSRFYIKLIRDRVWVTESGSDKNVALSVLRECLMTVSKLLAPITPFISEEIFLNLDGSKKSVFMSEWPEEDKLYVDKHLERHMEIAKEIIEAALAARQIGNLKLRQPVSEIFVKAEKDHVIEAVEKLASVIMFMCNSKSISTMVDSPIGNFADFQFKHGKVFVNKEISQNLLEETLVREVVRKIQSMRKENKFQVKESILLTLDSDEDSKDVLKNYSQQIAKEVGAYEIILGKVEGAYKDKLEFSGKKISLGFDRIK
ncbi:MAG: isoleucine--tRNA ligase [Candidatus Aenigmarchaeota archaeon]|nr:isoleucine--tRNA ligase [Candidatus Aenigmarchaeota archaeon]